MSENGACVKSQGGYILNTCKEICDPSLQAVGVIFLSHDDGMQILVVIQIH